MKRNVKCNHKREEALSQYNFTYFSVEILIFFCHLLIRRRAYHTFYDDILVSSPSGCVFTSTFFWKPPFLVLTRGFNEKCAEGVKSERKDPHKSLQQKLDKRRKIIFEINCDS